MSIKGESLEKSELFLMGHSKQYRNHYAESIIRIQHTLITIPAWSTLLLLLDNRKQHINKKRLINFFETYLE